MSGSGGGPEQTRGQTGKDKREQRPRQGQERTEVMPRLTRARGGLAQTHKTRDFEKMHQHTEKHSTLGNTY